MANEALLKTTTQVTLESAGATLASNALLAAGTALGTAAHLNYPSLDFVLAVAFSTSHAAGGYVALHAQNMNIDGTGDEGAPTTEVQPHFCGIFKVPSQSVSSTLQYTMLLQDIPSSPLGDVVYWIENKTTGAIGISWTLKVTPKTLVPGA